MPWYRDIPIILTKLNIFNIVLIDSLLKPSSLLPRHIMNLYILLSSALSIVLYIPLCKKILEGKIVQNFGTWILWTTINCVAAITIIIQNGNFLLPVTFTLGSSCVTVCIAISKNYNWTRFETLVACIVLACIIGWYISGPKLATIISAFALVISGIPQLIDAAKEPWSKPFLISSGYFSANILSIIGAKDWSVKEVLCPIFGAFYCGVMVLVVSRKFWIQKPANL